MVNQNDAKMDSERVEYLIRFWDRFKKKNTIRQSETATLDEILALMPNNEKKLHGFPMTRMGGKRKREQKRAIRDAIVESKMRSVQKTWWLRGASLNSLDIGLPYVLYGFPGMRPAFIIL